MKTMLNLLDTLGYHIPVYRVHKTTFCNNHELGKSWSIPPSALNCFFGF